MAFNSYEEQTKIREIISTSNRLNFVLSDKFKVTPNEITSIQVDGDNFKVDIFSKEILYRFKAKGTDSVAMKDIETGGMKMAFDPALAQGIYEICEDFAWN